jgi:nickel/cobalt exporter
MAASPPADGCCSGHAMPRAAAATPGGAAAAVLSVGLRPCTGALIVLVFALAQGLFWAGVASTFLMALGTGLTIAVLAAIAVGAKDVAARLARGDARRAGRIVLALELCGALVVTAFGLVLLGGALAG